MNVLIGSNGGLTGIYLAKQIRKIGGWTIIGSDSSEITAGKFFVDHQIKLPSAQSDDFIVELIKTLNDYNIDAYLPTHSKEIKRVSQCEHLIREKTSARFLVSPSETFEQLDNKRDANENLNKIGIPVPKMIHGLDCSYPIIMKNDVGSGGSGLGRIDNQCVHEALLRTKKNISFYQLIEGTEYTLDCMFSSKGEIIGYNQRERIKTIGGAVSITANSNCFDIWPWLERIASNWVFRGCVNFQYIVNNSIPYFIDVNLRYPSGGLPLTVESGLDIPKLTLDVLMGSEINKKKPIVVDSNLTMYRYFEEIFE